MLLTPLYIVAALRTRSKLGSTWTGIVMGTVAFLMGDGKYGILEIAKHIAPGFACDCLVPILFRGRQPGVIVCSVLGGVMGLGRYATIFLAMLAAGPPKLAFAFIIPGLIVHTSFGIISGLVSAPLVKRVAASPVPRTDDLEEAKAKT